MKKLLALLLLLATLAVQSAAATMNIVGFETGDTAEAEQSNPTSGTVSIQSSIVRTGSYALRSNPATTAIGWYRIASYNTSTGVQGNVAASTMYARFWFYVATAPASGDEPIFNAETTSDVLKFELRLNSSRSLAAYDKTPSLITTGSTVLALATWYRIEAKVGTGASAAWEVRINGSTEVSGNNDLGAIDGSHVKLGKTANRNGNSVGYYYDDFRLSNSAFPGDGSVRMMSPDADGFYTTWTIGAGSGSKWQQVDEVPPDGDTTYLVSTLVLNDAYTAALAGAAGSGITGTVNSVKAFALPKRDGAASSNAAIRFRSGSTNSDRSAGVVGSAYQSFGSLHDVDPATSSAWLLSALESIEVGFIEKETVNKTRLTFVAAMVDFIPAPGSCLVGARCGDFFGTFP